jgi:hypothetical protein
MAGKYLWHMAAHLISMKGRGILPVAGDECTVQWYLLIKNVSLLINLYYYFNINIYILCKRFCPYKLGRWGDWAGARRKSCQKKN